VIGATTSPIFADARQAQGGQLQVRSAPWRLERALQILGLSRLKEADDIARPTPRVSAGSG